MYTLKELKTASEKVADRYKIEYREAQNVIIKLRDTDGGSGVREILAGDFSKADKFLNFQTAKDVNTGEKIQADIIGESGSNLPEGFAEEIENTINEFKNKYGFEDLSKLGGQQWRACCLYVGQFVKRSGVLHDRVRERKEGGTRYNPRAVLELIGLWEYATTLTKHVPLRMDFIAFTGISNEYFYQTGRELTPAHAEIMQKVISIEEGAISAGLVDGRENPTGKIFYSKARLGWQEAPTIIQHETTQATRSALPSFNVPQIANNNS